MPHDAYDHPDDLRAAMLLGELERATPKYLMDFATYADVRRGVRTPHVLHIRAFRGQLELIGVHHTHNLRDPILALIQKRFRAFRPTAVYLEGGRPQPLPTLRETIGAYGEAGLLEALARKARVPTASLEPWRLDEAQFLWTRWDRAAVKLFYLLRDLQTWHRGHQAVPIEKHADVLLDNLARGGLTGTPRRHPDLQPLVEKYLPELATWREVPDTWFDPARFDLPTWTPEASRMSSAFRDQHAIRHLGRSMLRGERVMAVVGFTHTVMQAPVWRAWGPQVREAGGLS